MAMRHRAFWLDLLVKIGVPVFAGTLVACLLSKEFRAIHAVLIVVGIALIYLGHRVEHHGHGEAS